MMEKKMWIWESRFWFFILFSHASCGNSLPVIEDEVLETYQLPQASIRLIMEEARLVDFSSTLNQVF